MASSFYIFPIKFEFIFVAILFRPSTAKTIWTWYNMRNVAEQKLMLRLLLLLLLVISINLTPSRFVVVTSARPLIFFVLNFWWSLRQKRDIQLHQELIVSFVGIRSFDSVIGIVLLREYLTNNWSTKSFSMEIWKFMILTKRNTFFVLNMRSFVRC